mmetsp:Transcript_59051/g.97698  ORF Transcript_59051/g.97698 Transcript_59051/m.97698 type:complete len:97 (-) Transcript_59051:1617-1907(-)
MRQLDASYCLSQDTIQDDSSHVCDNFERSHICCLISNEVHMRFILDHAKLAQRQSMSVIICSGWYGRNASPSTDSRSRMSARSWLRRCMKHTPQSS